MTLANELLAQARLLAAVDPGIPSQANLRRASSAAYYALFHLLLAEAVSMLVPARPRGLQARVSRSFSHAEMQKVCSAISKPDSKDRFGALLAKPISDDLRFLAAVFTDMQQMRHTADYDVGAAFLRPEVLESIEDVQRAFAAWHAIRGTEEANVFLTALAFGARWSR